MRKEFTEELERLHVDFHKMGGMVTEQVHKAVKSFNEHDIEMAEEVIRDDQIINDAELEIEKDSIQLIALQAPVTSDLRKIITVMKASADLERMGDHASSIAKATIRIEKTEQLYDVEQDILQMALKVEDMVRDVLDAYVQHDVQKAREVAARDNEIDKMRDDIRDQVLIDSNNDGQISVSATDYVHIATYLERIGDYAKNIAEWILFLEEGEIVDLG